MDTHIWLGVQDKSMHLSMEQVQALLPLLTEFARSGNLFREDEPLEDVVIEAAEEEEEEDEEEDEEEEYDEDEEEEKDEDQWQVMEN